MMGQIGILGNSRLGMMIYRGLFTVVENHSKSLILQLYERGELRLFLPIQSMIFFSLACNFELWDYFE